MHLQQVFRHQWRCNNKPMLISEFRHIRVVFDKYWQSSTVSSIISSITVHPFNKGVKPVD